jgi:hypothetical protein
MKQPVYLKSFEYSIPASEKNFYDRDNLYGDYLEMPLKINIDLVNKYLILESNGFPAKFISSKTELTKFDFEKERIKVNTNIYYGLNINPSSSSNNELVFLMEGTIDDGENKNPCSGLLVIDSGTNRYEFGGQEWGLSVYLYDNYNDDREIKLDLMMYSHSQNAELN